MIILLSALFGVAYAGFGILVALGMILNTLSLRVIATYDR